MRRSQAFRPIAQGAAAAVAVLAASALSARADEHMVLVDKIDVGGNGLGTFDISFVDPTIDLYVLADRTNASVDFVDASDDTFIGRVPGFAGQLVNPDGTANNAASGPDGVVIVNHKEVWAGDGDSTVKVIDIATHMITDTVSTGGKLRCDEMAWDSADHILAVANNADTPPFVTFISTDSPHTVLGKIVFDGTNGTPNATTTGIEQPQWSPKTGLFYVSVPQFQPSDATIGAVTAIDPRKQSVVANFQVQNCSPAGLTLGPRYDALIGCSASFGTSPNVLTQSIVIDIRNGDTRTIPNVGGSDEVWYDKGTGHYYLAARNNEDNTGKKVPILGTVDAHTLMFDGGTPDSTTAHSVAADRISHHVFVPQGFIPPGGAADPTNPCPGPATTPGSPNGCIAVYVPSSIDDDDAGRQAAR
ncbi:MAG: hypothetical protein JO227_03240 [Acetobacteraceae bacterium]|nr:hypothetical protein [Acetobacteraceae bacterium]